MKNVIPNWYIVLISKFDDLITFDVYVLVCSMLKGRDEVLFGELVGRMSGVRGGRAREGTTLLLIWWLLRCVVEWKEVSPRFMWVRVKIERENWVFIPGYGPGSEKSAKKIEEFWNELNECVGKFGRNESVVVLGDLYARVGNYVIEGLIGQHEVPGRNERVELLLEMCAEQKLVVA